MVIWRELDANGWRHAHHKLSEIYPMPGDPRFDDDARFDQLPIFPGRDGTVIRAGDLEWEMPVSWAREYETRPPNLRRIKFDREVDNLGLLSKQPHGKALIRQFQRAVYLEMFRYRKPIAFSTVCSHADLHFSFIAVAATRKTSLSRLGYTHLLQAVKRIHRTDRKSIGAVYEMLRWWRARAPKSYMHFVAPPSQEALVASGASKGFDPSRIRTDDDEHEGKKWQPLPDAFVARLGQIALDLVENVRPVLNACLTELTRFRQQVKSEKEYRAGALDIVKNYEWPNGFRPTRVRHIRALAYLIQTATQILASLLLGPRASELLALRINAVKKKGRGNAVLDGHAFKPSESFTGDTRDWPLHPTLALGLCGQVEYVQLVEGPKFHFMWKRHVHLFNDAAPPTAIDGAIAHFVRYFKLQPLLKGTRCHHHRFRKTVARLIVVALHGGPVVLRRLFGHEHLAMTLRYILANDSIVDELREIAEEEHQRLAASFVKRAPEILGKGGVAFRETIQRAVEAMKVMVPEGKKDQGRVTAIKLVEFLADGPDGLSVKQVVPGLIACFKPREAAGLCSEPNELPNVAKCSDECNWHLMLPEFERQALINVADALKNVELDPDNKLVRNHFEPIVRHWHHRFPKTVERAFRESKLFQQIVDRPKKG